MAATIKIVVSQSSSGNAVADVKRDIKDMDSTAAGAGKGFGSLKTLGVAALGAVAAAAATATIAVGKFVVDSVGAAANFEASMNGLKAVTGDALEKAGFSLEDVSEKALQLGMDTQFSAQQAVEAMTELAKGGVPIEQVMNGATDATLALAAATGMELAPSAEILAKQLGVWSETGVTAAEVTDLLASAANASVVDVDELALGLANVGGVAKESGVEFDDLVTTMAMIAPGFSNAGDAGTSLKTLLVNMTPSTKEATEAMIALGLATEDGQSKFFDAEGSFIGMEAASQLLQDSLYGLSEAETTAALKTIFGVDAFRAAAAMANQGAEGFNAMGQAMADSGGAAAAAAAKNQGFSFAVEQLKGSIETLQIVLGTMLLPILTDFLNNTVTPGVNKIMAFVQTFDAASVGSINLVASLAQVSPAFNLLLGVVSRIIPQVEYIITTVFRDIEQFWMQNGATMVAQAQATWQGIQATIQALINAIVPVIQAFLAQIMIFWRAHGEEIMAFVAYAWGEINTIIQLALALIQATVVPLLQGIAQFINQHGSEIQSYISTTWTIIKNVIAAAIVLIKGIIQTTLQLIKGDFSGAWNTIQQMSGQFVALLWEAIKAGLGHIFFGWKAAWEEIKVFFQGIMDGIVGWVLQTLQGIVNALTSFAGAAKSAAGAVGNAIVNGISSGISDGAGKIINAAKDAAMSALNAAKSALGISSPSKVFANLVGKPMAEGMAVGLAGGAPMVAGAGAYAAGAAVAGASTYNQQRSMTYSPTINNYGSPSDGLDFTTAVSLAGV